MHPAVVIGEEHVLAVAAAGAAGPLRDVVLIAADHGPCDAWHGNKDSAIAGASQAAIKGEVSPGVVGDGGGLLGDCP